VTLHYYGTIKGQILKAIAVDSLYKWGEIRDSLGFTNEQLRPYIKELEKEGLIEDKPQGFRVEYNLWLQYKAHFGDDWAKKKLIDVEEDRKRQEELMRILSERKRRESENYLRRRVLKWIEFKKFDVEPDTSHIFLKGDQLDSLLCDLIPLSKKEILVVNPYVEKSALCDLLIQGIRKGVDVQLITRSPAKDIFSGKRQNDKVLYHKTLVESGVQLFYNEDVHAKLFILDKQVLSTSSMNLYSESIAGKLWEAGIASSDPYNLKLAVET
jgi:predicted transcriptional regulator